LLIAPPPSITPPSVTRPVPLPVSSSPGAVTVIGVVMLNAPELFCWICGCTPIDVPNCSRLPAIVFVLGAFRVLSKTSRMTWNGFAGRLFVDVY
jgi:hypothetical protein